jgi:hypothetical protein
MPSSLRILFPELDAPSAVWIASGIDAEDTSSLDVVFASDGESETAGELPSDA